jgi:hypothetical protein
MNRYKHLGINALLLPLLSLLGISPAFAATYNFTSVSGKVFIKSDATTKPAVPTGSIEFIVSFYAADGRADMIDPSTSGMTVVGGTDSHSPISTLDGKTRIDIPADCFNPGATVISDTLTSLTCNSDPSQTVNVRLVNSGFANVDLTQYVTAFKSKTVYSKSTGYGYIDITINFEGYNPGVEAPGSMSVLMGHDDGRYIRLNSSDSLSGSAN